MCDDPNFEKLCAYINPILYQSHINQTLKAG